MRLVYEYQTLISGVLAVLAAAGTAYVVWRAASLPVREKARNEGEEKARRLRYLCHILITDFRLLAARARQAEGTIRAVIAANGVVNDETREKTRLTLHPILDDWKFMSLVSPDSLEAIMKLRREVSDHNFDMDRAGGAFGADNFRQAILARIGLIIGMANGASNRMTTALPKEGDRSKTL